MKRLIAEFDSSKSGLFFVECITPQTENYFYLHLVLPASSTYLAVPTSRALRQAGSCREQHLITSVQGRACFAQRGGPQKTGTGKEILR